MIDLTIDFGEGFVSTPTKEQVQEMDSVVLTALKSAWIVQAENNGVLDYLRMIGEQFGTPFRPAHTKGDITDDYVRVICFPDGIILDRFYQTDRWIPKERKPETRETIVVRWGEHVVCRYYFHDPSHSDCVFVPGEWIDIVQSMRTALQDKLHKDKSGAEKILKAVLLKELLIDVV